MIRFDLYPQRLPWPQQLLLTDELIQSSRPHPFRQWLQSRRGLRLRQSRKQSHAPSLYSFPRYCLPTHLSITNSKNRSLSDTKQTSALAFPSSKRVYPSSSTRKRSAFVGHSSGWIA